MWYYISVDYLVSCSSLCVSVSASVIIIYHENWLLSTTQHHRLQSRILANIVPLIIIPEIQEIYVTLDSCSWNQYYYESQWSIDSHIATEKWFSSSLMGPTINNDLRGQHAAVNIRNISTKPSDLCNYFQQETMIFTSRNVVVSKSVFIRMKDSCFSS